MSEQTLSFQHQPCGIRNNWPQHGLKQSLAAPGIELWLRVVGALVVKPCSLVCDDSNKDTNNVWDGSGVIEEVSLDICANICFLGLEHVLQCCANTRACHQRTDEGRLGSWLCLSAKRFCTNGPTRNMLSSDCSPSHWYYYLSMRRLAALMNCRSEGVSWGNSVFMLDSLQSMDFLPVTWGDELQKWVQGSNP